jgi:hypothetical protein
MQHVMIAVISFVALAVISWGLVAMFAAIAGR